MLAAAAKKHSSAGERRSLHLELASAVNDPALRALHLAIATEVPDGDVAAVASAAAELALKRGAVPDAEALAAHALRLTPSDAVERADRVLALARLHTVAGDLGAATALLNSEMSEIPAGPARARAYMALGEAADVPSEEQYLKLALAEAGDDPEVRALALSRQALIQGICRVEGIGNAEVLASEALSAAQMVGGDLAAGVRIAVAWIRILRGRPIDDLYRRSEHLSPADVYVHGGAIDRPRGVRLAFRGELDAARVVFGRLIALADERGELLPSLQMRLQLCEVELRAGDLTCAGPLLEDIEQLTLIDTDTTVSSRLRAVMAAVAGRPLEAHRWASTVLASENFLSSLGWDKLEAHRAAGLAALFGHDLSQAVENLQTVWAHTRAHGVDDPGAFPVAGDLVEALILLGDQPAAVEVTRRLGALAADQRHPWGLVTTRRCEAAIQLADRYVAEAAAAMAEVADAYGDLGLHFDQARTLLFLGRIQRRFRKRGDARRSLADAASRFENCGCFGWADQARAELDRISGRRADDKAGLTPTEQRIVDLAAGGLSNKEIAGQLVVSVHTVEAHLSRAYAKLGVRSRGQLGGRLEQLVRD
jgi:DNA-binding CsgD family transcriptional regulator